MRELKRLKTIWREFIKAWHEPIVLGILRDKHTNHEVHKVSFVPRKVIAAMWKVLVIGCVIKLIGLIIIYLWR